MFNFLNNRLKNKPKYQAFFLANNIRFVSLTRHVTHDKVWTSVTKLWDNLFFFLFFISATKNHMKKKRFWFEKNNKERIRFPMNSMFSHFPIELKKKGNNQVVQWVACTGLLLILILYPLSSLKFKIKKINFEMNFFFLNLW